MDISKKQAKWRKERPLFEAELIHTHLLPSFEFNENTGDYEIKPEIVSKTDDEDRKVAYETLNTGWVMWLRAKASVPEGFVLVPREPTEKMVQAGIKTIFEQVGVRSLYKAMIEAQEQK